MPDTFRYDVPVTVNLLIAVASTPTYYEECLKAYLEEDSKNTEENYEWDKVPVEYIEVLAALEQQDQDGQIAMARRVCRMLGHEYDLPEGYKDSTL